MRVLNLGCGNKKNDFPEFSQAIEVVGVDLSNISDADILHNLDNFPYPLESDYFDLVIMQDVVEHLENVPGTLNEVYRVCKNGAELRLRTPHYAGYYAYGDQTHKRFFSIYAFDGFNADKPNLLYTESRFKFLERTIEFPKLWRITGVAWLANKFSHRWEQLFAYIFRPENIYFRMKAIK